MFVEAVITLEKMESAKYDPARTAKMQNAKRFIDPMFQPLPPDRLAQSYLLAALNALGSARSFTFAVPSKYALVRG